MAKRELYKPAPSTLAENLQNSPNSRSLAQGILSAKNSSWQEELSRSTISQEVTLQKSAGLRRSLLSSFHGEESFKTPEKTPVPRHINRTQENKSDIVKSPGLIAQQQKITEDPKNRKIFTLKNEVVVVDASGPVLNPDLSEVSTTSHKVFSPAKVICHSPSPERSPRRERQMIEENIKVKVESPKEIIFGNENTSENDTAETNSQISGNKDSLPNQISQEKVTKKKKKAPRIIQSRYKNPKEQKPQKPLETNSKPSKPLTQSFFHDISAIASNPTAQGQVKGQMAKTKKAKVTSTPFNPAAWSEKTRNYVADGSYLDVSKNLTVGQHDVIQEIAKKQKGTRDKVSGNIAPIKGKISGADSGIVAGTQSSSEQVSDLQLEMKYCRMLQAMYVHAKAKDTFAKQEKTAKYQIYKVWQENQKLKTDVRNLEKAIYAKKHTMALDQLLKAQDSGLRSVEDSLDQFHNNYLTLGEVLDSTRHYLPVEGVKIQDEEKLISALKESHMLLAQISSYTGSAETDVTKLSTDMNLLAEKLTSQISEQDNCQELLLAVSSLTNQERSLQSHILQS